MVGCGDLGSRIARGLLGAGATMHALTRRPLALPEVTSLCGDVTDFSSLPELPPELDELVYCLTPVGRTEQYYRLAYVQGLSNVLARLRGNALPRITFISSTAVYAAAGSWVDESSVCVPEEFNGRVLLEAEQVAIVAQACARVLRLGGIYGPGRESLIRNVTEGRPISARSLDWGNRVHVDDAAAAACHLIHIRAGGVFNLVDNMPASAADVMDWIAIQLGLSALSRPESGSETLGRRVKNAKLLASGFTFRYPDFRAGYASLLPD